MPTLLDFLDISGQSIDGLPGHSFAAQLASDNGGVIGDDGNEEVVVFDEYGPVRMIRTYEWKYVHRYPFGAHELYDLVNDPYELHNAFTDSGCTGMITEAQELMRRQLTNLGDPALRYFEATRMHGGRR